MAIIIIMGTDLTWLRVKTSPEVGFEPCRVPIRGECGHQQATTTRNESLALLRKIKRYRAIGILMASIQLSLRERSWEEKEKG